MLEGLAPEKDSRGCKIATIMGELSPEDRTILEAALNDKARWSSHGLMVALRQRGLELSITPIISHRKGHCKCSRT